MRPPRSIRNAHSRAEDPRQAVQEFRAGVWQPEMELVIFFCSSAYDRASLAEEMSRQFAGTRVVGCTTAGEIGASGYVAHSLTGASFPAGTCTAATGFLGSLHDFGLVPGQAFARSVRQQLEARDPAADGGNAFAFLLIDGLSTREEQVTRTFQDALGDIRLIGGSAGDDLKLERTWVFHDGTFHTDAAVLVLISTRYPFRIFNTQHFVTDAERLVVTSADVAHRVVREINGLPAAEEYARMVGVPVHELIPAVFAASPVVVRIEGTDYVRSIQRANPDGSLTFYCAIDEGLVLRVAHGRGLLANLEQAFESFCEDIGPPQLVIACDCILRGVEMAQQGLTDTVTELFRRNNTVGFSTYGEQFCGVHVNQTLTGVAIGSAEAAADADVPCPPAGLPFQTTRQPEAAQSAPTAPGRTDLAGKAALRDEIARLNKIIAALMDRAERAMGAQGSDFGMFQTAILLEDQVRTRTRELEEARLENERINRDLQQANRELEAFSYSVAHDLRAPLRGIDGFSRMLELGWADHLDDTGRQHLQRVREGAQRLGQLIDDLLRLSRCSRADLTMEPVDLAALARQVMAALAQAEPQRQVEFTVAETFPAWGDARLLAVVLENLLGNAWKYTRRRPLARIDFGYDPNLSAYFVRDNGAGFDMAYAGKLFKVCQRLHSASEFEGTGIGLAIVQRIIERHGGRIWADARKDEGATFHFTLPEAPGS
ncbi:MAG TPA: nitric oxide-sensing protein NosP [Rhodocyclaceae bacterium]|nr:nitric oxide-sensing protein NosP [Rhodocyclaceae bacterium]